MEPREVADAFYVWAYTSGCSRKGCLADTDMYSLVKYIPCKSLRLKWQEIAGDDMII